MKRIAFEAADSRLLSPDLPLAFRESRAERDARVKGFGEEYMITVLATALAVLALVLAAIGLFGLTACSVSRRTGEWASRWRTVPRPLTRRGLC